MKGTKSKIQGSWMVILMIGGLSLWILSWAGVAAADVYGDSAHGHTSNGVNRSGTGDAIGNCTHCHDTFDPDICGVNETMLFAELDNPDFCMECHTDSGSVQVGGMSGGSGNIETVFGKTYRHDVTGYSGLHMFSPEEETRIYLSANKHVECNDCHNPHTAKAGLHSTNNGHVAAGTNAISDSGPLTGALGAEPNSWQPWNYGNGWDQGGAGGWPSTVSTAEKEYQICFKCHADYNTNVLSWGGTGTASWTDLALEFNPYKQSYHPVVQALPEIDPGYSYDSYWDEESDYYGSNQLPPAFTSLVIGDSGLKTAQPGSSLYLQDSSKAWTNNQWEDWGVRFGTRDWQRSDPTHDSIRNVASNDSNTLAFGTGGLDHDSNYTVYSIEYYAGRGASKLDYTVTHSIKDFSLYVPSLVGYKVVIQEDLTSTFGQVDWVAVGTVTSNTTTSFTVDDWTLLYGTTVPSSGTVAYYFSAAGQTMMCSDCHSGDTISSTDAQGPHGSGVKWMLKGRNKAWPLASAASNGAGDDGANPYAVHYLAGGAQARRYENDGTADGLFCLNCHSTVGFSKGGDGLQNASNVHLLHNSPCVNCHVMVPHGSKYSRLIGEQSDMPPRYAFDNDLSNMGVTWYVMKAFDPDHSGRAGGPAAYPQGSHGSNLYCTFNCHW